MANNENESKRILENFSALSEDEIPPAVRQQRRQQQNPTRVIKGESSEQQEPFSSELKNHKKPSSAQEQELYTRTEAEEEHPASDLNTELLRAAAPTPEEGNATEPGQNRFKIPLLRGKLTAWSFKIGLAAAAVLSLLFIYFDAVVLAKFEVDDRFVLPAVVYSRPLELYPDQKLSLEQMLYELKLLKYRNSPNPSRPGEYGVNEQTGKIVLIKRPFDFPDRTEEKMSLLLQFSGQRLSSIENADTREELGYIRMDPVLLDRINRIDPREDRIFLQLEEVPQRLIETLLEIEDRSFYSNMGVNFFAIGRAFVKNYLAGHVVEGGSTITQQLVKNYFLSSQRSYTRKFKEIMMALIMTKRYSKDQILEAYLNEIYLGQNGNAGIYGFGLAAYFYFGVPVAELTQDQMALLVGIIKGPSYYDPWRHPEAALERRNVVLTVMHNRGYLSDAEYTQYTARPLGVIKRGMMNYSKTPAFMGVLKHEIANKFGDDFLSGNGIRIFTSLDPQAQQAAENAVFNELNKIEKETGREGLEAAMVVSNWRNAEVAAVVGSRTPQYEGFNRVLEGRRQVGSIIKPFVYLTAFHYGVHMGTMVRDEPLTVKLSSGKYWQPKNDDGKFKGPVTVRYAMAHSMNVPTVKIGMHVGLNHVLETLRAVGFKQELPLYPSMLLGTEELTPYEVNAMYASLATDGVFQDLTTLRTVVKNGEIVYERQENKGTATLDPRDSYLTLQVMLEATRSGTGRRIGRMFPNMNIATKTGTTNDNRDTWTVGLDNDEVVSVWVGFDNNRSTGLFGSSGAMRVYGAYLTLRGVNPLELKRPQGIKFVGFNSKGNVVSDRCRVASQQLLPVRVDMIRYVDDNCGGVQVFTPPAQGSRSPQQGPRVTDATGQNDAESESDRLEREVLGL